MALGLLSLPSRQLGYSPSQTSKGTSMREAEWESAVETVMGAMQGLIQLRRFNPLTVSRVLACPN
jgi:hypothetical protein